MSRCLALAVCIAGACALPAAAAASPVDLGTAASFVVLGGTTVTNTGSSVLNGDLGVAPGTSLTGFGLPAVVNGATHDNDAVAAQGQADLTTAYTVAAGQPVAPAADLTGQDLGGKTLVAGAYRYSSSAQLTGPVTLDAQGDAAAQFVILIGSTLTTASASSVVLVNGASPCNVYWQVGSSATLGTTTAFQGNLMALSDITLDSGASVIGRVMARNGAVTLIDNVLSRPGCAATGTGTSGGTGTTTTTTTTTATTAPVTTGAAVPRPAAGTAPARGTGAGGGPGSSADTPNGRVTFRRPPAQRCTAGFSGRVRGAQIKTVTFRLDGRRIAALKGFPRQVFVRATSVRTHKVTARLTFRDGTRARTLTLPYRVCAAAELRPRPGSSQFTG